jgi:NADPH:quinone reductase-like Zn-dependent oxidoreductase
MKAIVQDEYGAADVLQLRDVAQPAAGDGEVLVQVRGPLAGMFTRQALRGLTSRERAEDLEELASLIESGQVAPVFGRTYPLAGAPDAIRYLAAGHALGKVVITI